MAIRHDCAITLAVFLLVCSMSMAHSPALAEQPPGLPAAAQNKEPAAKTGRYTPLTEAQKLASCMELWDPATHMSKTLWKTVCKRIETKN